MPPNPADIQKEPMHKWLDKTNLFPGTGVFTFVLQSGGDFQVYVMIADHAKQIAKMFAKKVEEYERENGELEGRLSNEPMKSPIDIGTHKPPYDDGTL